MFFALETSPSTSMQTYISSFIIASVPHMSKWQRVSLPLCLSPSDVYKVFTERRLNRWILKLCQRSITLLDCSQL